MALLSSIHPESQIYSTMKPKYHSKMKQMTADQSFELVCVIACAVVAEVVTNRRLLPPECMAVKLYNIADPECSSYDGFIQCRQDPSTLYDRQAQTPECFTFRVFQRDVDSRSNKILKWLDGVREAIRIKFLASMHFRIYDSKIDVLNQIEEYCLTLSYSERGPDVAYNFKKASVNSVVFKSLQDVEADLGKLIHALMQKLGQKGPVEGNPIVNMKLEYNDSAPKGYHPPGFRHGEVDCMSAVGRHTLMKDDTVGSLNTGYHNAAVGLWLSSSAITNLQHVQKIYTPTRGRNRRDSQLTETPTTIQSIQPAQNFDSPVVNVFQGGNSMHLMESEQRVMEQGQHTVSSNISNEETQVEETAGTCIRRLEFLRSEHKNLGSRNDNLPDTSPFTVFPESNMLSLGDQLLEDEDSLNIRSTQNTPAATITTPKQHFTQLRRSVRVESAVGNAQRISQAKRKANSVAMRAPQRKKLSSALAGSQTSPLKFTEDVQVEPLAGSQGSPALQVSLR